MTRNRKIVVGLVGVAVVGWLGYANLGLKRTSGANVNTEKIQLRDLQATVSASGKVQPKREVKVSNEASGKVMRLAVREGDMVTKGQVLVEIDPTQLQTTVENREASLASAQSTLAQMNVQVDTAKVMKGQAEETMKRADAQLKSGLISREAYERAQNDVKNAAANLKSAEQSVLTQMQRIKQEEANLSSAQIDYTKVKVYSPITGIVTKRLIEEGEMARYSALSGGTDLLSIADMSGVQSEIEVDETDIPHIALGQPAKVTIDAIPDQSFPGKVTEVGNSPIQVAGAAGRSTNFKVVITLDGSIPSVRPGFTCTAVITTATRTKVMSVPIQAMAVRELVVDAQGNPVKTSPVPSPGSTKALASATPSATPAASAAPKPGETRKEIEGVFLVQNGRAVFTPVKVGIAGEKYFEALSGLKEGDEVITGPATIARTLKDGDEVKATPRAQPNRRFVNRTLMQQFFEAANIALQAIWANKLRSLLTVIGNIVAVTSIIAVVSLVQGLNASVKDVIQSQVGADTFAVTRNPVTFTHEQETRAASNPRITLDEAEALRTFGGHIRLVMAEAGSGSQAKYRSESLDSLRIRGVTKEYPLLSTTRIERGRPITPREFEDGRSVAILGWGAADRLFGVNDPLDKTITLAGSHFTVVGVVEKKGSILGQSQDEFAIVPLAAFQKIFGSRQSLQLTVLPTDPSFTKTAMDDATAAMRIQRKLRPKDKDNFGVVSSDTFLDLYNQVTAGIFAILIGVVSLSLVVGGIVIMNIMLMVVTERTREIGLRKSLGARRRDVLWQILTESITLSTFGGIVGTGLGFLVANIISRVSPLPAIVEVWSVVLGIGMTAGVGLFFGLYPATRAAKLDPIEALRRE